jgi:Tol biopolymer transport system component
VETTLRNVTTQIYAVTLRHAFAIPSAAMPSEGRYAEWAARPDVKGQRVAFESNDGGDREIFAATTDGAFDLSNHHAADWNPVWAPSGQWLAFESFRGGTRGIYRAHRETARNESIAVSEAGDFWGAAWSPDARWIACAGNPDGSPQIYVANVGNGEMRRVTHDDAVSFDAPAWRPGQ